MWLLGLAKLTDVPESRDVSSDEVQQILGLCQQMSSFPSGPVGYLDDGYLVNTLDQYRSVTLSSPVAPHLQMQIGIGQGGYVALGLTRSGYFGEGCQLPSGVLITDMESVMADMYTLTTATAVQLGYQGRVDLLFAVSDQGPGLTPSFYALDEEDGGLVCTGQLSAPLEPLRHSFVLSPDTLAESIHVDLYAVAKRFAERVGAGDAQLVRPTAGDLATYADNALSTAYRKFNGGSTGLRLP